MKVNTTGGNTGGTGAVGSKMHGVFLGKIKDNIDPDGLGRLRVWIPQLSNSTESNKQGWFTVDIARLLQEQPIPKMSHRPRMQPSMRRQIKATACGWSRQTKTCKLFAVSSMAN